MENFQEYIMKIIMICEMYRFDDTIGDHNCMAKSRYIVLFYSDLL